MDKISNNELLYSVNDLLDNKVGLEELEELAKKASRGPWGAGTFQPDPLKPATYCMVKSKQDERLVICTLSKSTKYESFSKEVINNAKFIAAANPLTVLMLIGIIRSLLKKEEER